jgi:diguanylate cyclase
VAWWPTAAERRKTATLERLLRDTARLIGRAVSTTSTIQSLLAQSHRDPLTGLLNRRGILEALEREIARAGRAGSPVSVLFLDLNGFKLVNDRLGHCAGDEALVAVSRVLEQEVRASDLLGRIGGDELLAVLPDTDLRPACRLGRRLARRLYATPIETSAGSVRIGLTYGAAGLAEALGGTDLVEIADRRMLHRKRRDGQRRQPPLLCPFNVTPTLRTVPPAMSRPG